MALFKRADLKAKGLTDEQIEYLMTESNRALSADYAPKSDIQAQIDAAKAAAPAPTDPTQTKEYLELAGKAAKLEAFQTEDFSSIKKPYRDIVWDKLDHGDKHKPYAEQMTELATSLPDLFNTPKEQPPEPNKPHFGAPTQGQMPTGKEGPSFMDGWGFVPQKKG